MKQQTTAMKQPAVGTFDPTLVKREQKRLLATLNQAAVPEQAPWRQSEMRYVLLGSLGLGLILVLLLNNDPVGTPANLFTASIPLLCLLLIVVCVVQFLYGHLLQRLWPHKLQTVTLSAPQFLLTQRTGEGHHVALVQAIPEPQHDAFAKLLGQTGTITIQAVGERVLSVVIEDRSIPVFCHTAIDRELQSRLMSSGQPATALQPALA